MYIGNDLSRGRSETYYYTSTSGGETAITTDTSGKTINYTPGFVSVFLNGVRLHDSDFTATTGNSITGLVALTQDDVVIIEAQHTFSSSDAVSSTGGTFTGAVTLPSPVINTGVSGSAILDSDTMSGASATKLASSESIKAYADTKAPLASPTFTGTTTLSGDLVPSTPLSNRNFIINGGMQIWQRASGTTTISNGYHTADRYLFGEGNDGAYTSEKHDMSLAEFNTTGHKTALQLDVTTADTSLGASVYTYYCQRIEAQNLAPLRYGTANAKTITLSFWVKSNKTGVYTICFRKNDGTVYYLIKEYTISSADTWEQKKITITPTEGSTTLITNSGGEIDNNNGVGLELYFGLGYGSNYHATKDTWSTNEDYSTSSAVNWMDSTSNNYYVTGIQLELGENATPFEHRSFGDELFRCSRYFQILQGQGQNVQIGTAYWWNNAELGATINLTVPLRGTITTHLPSGTNYYRWQAGSAYYTTSITGVSTGPTRSGNGDNTQIKTLSPYAVSVSGTWGQAGSFYAQGSNFSAGEYLAVSSEL